LKAPEMCSVHEIKTRKMAPDLSEEEIRGQGCNRGIE
jgi:hypothetical protein